MSSPRILVTIAVLTATSGCTFQRPPAPGRLDQAGFQKLIGTLTDGWNSNNARQAADCFTEDAMFSSPPNPEIRKGRRELFEFFGGETGRPKTMSILWHHLIFDPASQIGAGEYTFTYQVRTHGMVILRIVNGKIANWRQYEIESRMNWEEMVGENRF
jgi:SnoaL-like protein